MKGIKKGKRKGRPVPPVRPRRIRRIEEHVGRRPPRRLVSSGSKFEEIAAYSRAVIDGPWVFVSGTTGFDYEAGTIDDDVGTQAEQTIRNIEWALQRANAGLADIVRLRVYITEARHFAAVAQVLGRHFREIRPANTTVIAPLIDPRMKVEIEATARIRPSTEGHK
ncbi:MAG: RidA family protein [Rhodospirillales bacterium]|nr:RidA family protein [Rhodospirillales bacterium]